jgi:site-specific DNA-methyltransferase (adenine-specific)
MEYMRDQPDNAFDLAIVDPPYGINADRMSMGSNTNRKDDSWSRSESTAKKVRKSRLNHGRGRLADRALNTMDCEWDKKPPSPDYFKELFRVSKNQIIWGGNYFDLPPTRCAICWDKVQPWDNFSQWEMAWASFDKPAPLFRHSNTGGNNRSVKIHPTQKPIELYEWILNKFSEKGQRILDTHLGSGSSAIAAHYYGVDFVGCELDQDYFKAAQERIERETSQISMF